MIGPPTGWEFLLCYCHYESAGLSQIPIVAEVVDKAFTWEEKVARLAVSWYRLGKSKDKITKSSNDFQEVIECSKYVENEIKSFQLKFSLV